MKLLTQQLRELKMNRGCLSGDRFWSGFITTVTASKFELFLNILLGYWHTIGIIFNLYLFRNVLIVWLDHLFWFDQGIDCSLVLLLVSVITSFNNGIGDGLLDVTYSNHGHSG